MAFTVPTNQPVSRTVYGIAVAEAARLPNDFIREKTARIDLAFKAGEPIAMIVEELKLLYSLRRPARSKTPRQLAKSIVRVCA
jgi:hypothetical protein